MVLVCCCQGICLWPAGMGTHVFCLRRRRVNLLQPPHSPKSYSARFGTGTRHGVAGIPWGKTGAYASLINPVPLFPSLFLLISSLLPTPISSLPSTSLSLTHSTSAAALPVSRAMQCSYSQKPIHPLICRSPPVCVCVCVCALVRMRACVGARTCNRWLHTNECATTDVITAFERGGRGQRDRHLFALSLGLKAQCARDLFIRFICHEQVRKIPYLIYSI